MGGVGSMIVTPNPAVPKAAAAVSPATPPPAITISVDCLSMLQTYADACQAERVSGPTATRILSGRRCDAARNRDYPSDGVRGRCASPMRVAPEDCVPHLRSLRIWKGLDHRC